MLAAKHVRSGRSRWGLALSAAALALTSPAWAGGDPSLPIKAAYLYKLGAFVDWPADAFTAPDQPLNLCVQGVDPFGAVLDQSVLGQQVNGHPVVVKRLAKVDKDSPCRILYVAGAKGQSVGGALAAARGAPMLTVTDAAPSGSRGIVDFQLVEGKVRFAIDLDAAQANRLTVSSRLLSLAVGVSGGPATPAANPATAVAPTPATP